MALVALAASMLVGGMLIYLLGRAPGSAWLLPVRWQIDWQTHLQGAAGAMQGADAGWVGSVGLWLPSFVHAFSFSVLTAWLLPHRPAWAARACGFWAVVDSLAEIGQHPSVAPSLAAAIAAALDGAPLATQLGRYFTRGSFDAADVMAGLAGCASAWLALRWALRRGESRPGDIARDVARDVARNAPRNAPALSVSKFRHAFMNQMREIQK